MNEKGTSTITAPEDGRCSLCEEQGKVVTLTAPSGRIKLCGDCINAARKALALEKDEYLEVANEDARQQDHESLMKWKAWAAT